VIDIETLQILSELSTLIGLTSNAVALLNQIVETQRKTAVEHYPYEISNLVDVIYSLATDPTWGNEAIQALIAANQATLTSQLDDIEVAVGTPAQAGVPVPIESGSVTDIQAAVWSYNVPGSTFNASDAIGAAGNLPLNLRDLATVPAAFSNYFWIVCDWSSWSVASHVTVQPQPLAANILPDDTVLTWLQREVPSIAWAYGYWGADFVAGQEPDGYFIEWVCKLTSADFDALKAAMFPETVRGAPVWPGLANVVLGATVALSDGLLLMGPLAGVIVTITSVPKPISYYPFGSIRSYVRAGAIVFTNDNGDSEFPSPFGPDDQVIVPVAMEVAGSCTVRLPSGVVGTITPWSLA
jgi:hypothetical protein